MNRLLTLLIGSDSSLQTIQEEEVVEAYQLKAPSKAKAAPKGDPKPPLDHPYRAEVD